MLCVGRATIKGGVEWITGFSIPAAVVVHDGSWKRWGERWAINVLYVAAA